MTMWSILFARVRARDRKSASWALGRGIAIVAVTVTLGPAACDRGKAPALRVGVEAAGTFSWITFAIRHYGIDADVGLEFRITNFPTKHAKELAFRMGEVDILVDDFIGISRWKHDGLPATAVNAYSSNAGSIMVPVNSVIESIPDLNGRVLGAPAYQDRTLLALRAVSVACCGFDPQRGEIVAAAPPLLEELLVRRQLDAVILPWHLSARLAATGGYREIASFGAMLRSLGFSPDLPNLVIVARDELDPSVVRSFLGAVASAVERMDDDPEIWPAILEAGLYSLPDPAAFPAVVARWRSGITPAWDGNVTNELVHLLETLARLAGSEALGVDGVHPDAFTTAFQLHRARDQAP